MEFVPGSRAEKYYSKILRELDKMATGSSDEWDGELPKPLSRAELYYEKILERLGDIAEDSGDDIDPEVIKQAVQDWINAHPEAVTTVTDGSITYEKLDTTLKEKADAVSDVKSALNNNIPKSVQFFYTIKDEYYGKNGGVYYDTKNISFRTEKMPCNPGDEIEYYGRADYAYYAVTWYDKDHNVLSSQQIASLQTATLTAPANAKFCAFSSYSTPNFYVINKTNGCCTGSTIMKELDRLSGIASPLEGIDKVLQYEQDKNETTVDVDGKYVSTNGIIAGYNVCYICGPIAVNAGDYIFVHLYVNSATAPVVYCNEAVTSFELIDSSWSSSGGVKDLSFVADRNGFICITSNKDRRAGSYYKVCRATAISQLGLRLYDLNQIVTSNAEEVQYVAENKKLFQTKNLFNKDTIIVGYYIDTASGGLSHPSSSENFAVSDLIPVEPGHLYYVYRNGSGSNEVRFVKSDKITPIKALNPDGTERSSYVFSAQGCVLAPPEAAYFQCTVKFNTAANPDTIQVEEGTEHTDYVPYERRDYLDYPGLPPGFNGIVEKVEELENQSSVDHITIANSGKIGFFSNSFLNGYTMRTHHALDNLGMWSDYIMYNYGKSGDDALECLARINANQSFLGDVPVQSWGMTYGVIAMQDNDGALYSADHNTYFENFKKIAEAIRAMGATPILGSEHDIAGNYYGLMALSQQEGYLFMDWGKLAYQTGRFTPMWYNGHPATRTAWLWTYGMLPYFENLPRPERGIKLFRKRPDTGTALQDLVYNNVYERAERYVEIYTGTSCLTKATEKYFDRQNNGLTSYESVNDEYQKLQSKTGTVNFGTHALIECITPYTAKGLTYLVMNLDASGVTHAYIKRNLSFANPLPDVRKVAFGVVAGENLLTPGTQFQITGGVFNDNLLGTYTVEGVINSMVVTTTSSSGKTTSGTDNPTTNISGVTLQGSYDYPTADYMSRFNKPLAEWDEFSLDPSGKTELTSYLSKHMDYDKIAILLVGTDVTITSIDFTIAGHGLKNDNHQKPIRKFMKGTSLITSTLLEDDSNWDNIQDVPKYTPVTSGVDGTTKEPLPAGISVVRELSEGNSITQTFSKTSLNTDPYHLDHIQIRVLARYFPKYIANDDDWNTTEIYEGSYDCAEMSVTIDNGGYCGVCPVGAFWNEFIFDAYYQPYGNTATLKIKCEKKKLQIARVEMVLVED